MRDLPCRKNPTDFYAPTQEARTAAKTACLGCSVRPDCLRAAIDNDERFGIWGGLTPDERWQLTHNDGTWLDRRGTIRQPCGSEESLKRHKRLKEQCVICEQADYRRRLDIEHAVPGGGSASGAHLHRLLRQEPCEPCRAAHAAASRAGRPARTRIAA
ncbi:WhiB family transcriptional regulator [Streptomyces kronopolitis]|uniref:WhiB family transcriptional regulator n=1 Tax=Streptomyces kronopolitis TaxID=1612435 RepID=UPI003F4E2AAA